MDGVCLPLVLILSQTVHESSKNTVQSPISSYGQVD